MTLVRPKDKKFDWPQTKERYSPSQCSAALKKCFSQVYVLSSNCAKTIDPAWDGWRQHVKEYMKVPDD